MRPSALFFPKKNFVTKRRRKLNLERWLTAVSVCVRERERERGKGGEGGGKACKPAQESGWMHLFFFTAKRYCRVLLHWQIAHYPPISRPMRQQYKLPFNIAVFIGGERGGVGKHRWSLADYLSPPLHRLSKWFFPMVERDSRKSCISAISPSRMDATREQISDK